MKKIVVDSFDDCLYGFYDAVRSGEKTLQQAIEEFLTFPIKGIESVTPQDKAILMQRARKAFRRFEKEEEESGWFERGEGNGLYESKKMNEGIRKTQCYEFESFLIKNFYAIQKGRKRTADVVKEFLDSIGKTNDKNAFDQLLRYAKKEVLKMQQTSEIERFGGVDDNLWESKKVKISEQKLKSIIKESIDEIMTGGYGEQWKDPDSLLRQFGDDWLRVTLDLVKKYKSTIQPQELISLMQPITTRIVAKIK